MRWLPSWATPLAAGCWTILSSWGPPQLSKALHISARFNPDLGWPYSLFSSWLAAHCPNLPCLFLSPCLVYLRSSQSVSQLPTLPNWPRASSLRLSSIVLSSCVRAKGWSGASQGIHQMTVWVPGAGLLSTAVLVPRPLSAVHWLLLPLERALCSSHCPSPL